VRRRKAEHRARSADPGRTKGAPADEQEPLDTRRKWVSVAVATIPVIASFWLIVIAIIAADPDTDLNVPPLALLIPGVLLVPVAFYVLARMSGQSNRVQATLNGTFFGGSIALWLPLAVGEPVSPLVAGFGIGAVASLRRHPSSTTTARVVAVLVATVYMLAMVRVLPPLSLAVAPLLSFPAVAVADGFTARRAEDA
jgi:hypothetical protein